MSLLLRLRLDSCRYSGFSGKEDICWGEEPSHLRVVPPGQRSNAVACLERMFVILSVHGLA